MSQPKFRSKRGCPPGTFLSNTCFADLELRNFHALRTLLVAQIEGLHYSRSIQVAGQRVVAIQGNAVGVQTGVSQRKEQRD